MTEKSIKVLMIEDDLGEIELTRESLKFSKVAIDLHCVQNGEQALIYLRRQSPVGTKSRPDLVLLDLNLPRKNGRDVLKEMRSDPHLRSIPVIILTTSSLTEDILKMYELGANCYITKPIGLEQYSKVIQSIQEFWFNTVKLPSFVQS